ncbi:hypothetical protein J1N35_007447, partial [Gossypium stocksii]
LYVEFTYVDGYGPSSTSIATNTGTKVQAESPTIQFYGGFFNLLQSGYYDLLGTFMGRHSSVSGIDLNFKDQYQSGDGMSNIVLKGDNEGVDEEGDAGEEEGVTDANEGEELKPKPIWQRDLDGSEMEIFFKLDLVTTASKPCGSEDDASDNVSNLDP